MARHRSLTSQLYALARTSNNARSMARGPSAYAKRQVRKKVYGKEMGLTRSLLKAFGMSR